MGFPKLSLPGGRVWLRGAMAAVATNCSLRVKRLLLDAKFEGYKLSLEPLACYQVGLDSPVAEVKLRDDQYTLDHMRAFGMYNYLHLDPWYQDNVYYVDQLGRIMNLSITLILFNEEFESPFVIVHSVSFVNSDAHSVSVLLLRVEKDDSDVEGSGFHVSLEWVTITKTAKEGDQGYEISKRRLLQGKSVPHYAAIEPSGDGLMVISYKPYTFIQQSDENEYEGSEKKKAEEKKKEPLYYWQQTKDDLTVTLHLPEDFTKEDIHINFSSNRISLTLKEQPRPVLEGTFYSSIDHESSTWIIKENNSLEISLMKKEEGHLWPELIVGDSQGELIMDPAQSAAIAEQLMHLTSEEMNPDPSKENPPCNAQELEECDIFLEDSTSLCRFDGNTLKVTHVVSVR
ncbi:hypothetical protein lerEdw1_010692 [Lerista edwardsae]|nr:hypothetical protein lerEdw1_010692 [Lerista edwardsae]